MEQLSRKQEVVIVTGSSGLLGQNLVEDLCSSYRVVGLDVEAPPEGGTPLSAFYQCDLTQDDSVEEVFTQIHASYGARIAAVVHLATYYDFSGKSSDLYQALTVEGTRRLIRELQSFAVGRFVLRSSLLVMQPAEEVLKYERGRIPVTILRLAGVYDEEGHSPPIAQQMARIYERQFESFFLPGSSDHHQPFVHIDDAVCALRKAVDLRDSVAPFSVYLIAEEDAPSYAELQEQMGELIHGKPRADKLADSHYLVSTTKAKEQLGWRPSRRLRGTLPAMVDSLKANPARFYAENDLDKSA